MKDFFKFNLNTVLLAVVIFLWLTDGCNKDSGVPGSSDTIRTETVYRYDTVVHEILTHKIYYESAANVDTSQFIVPAGHDTSGNPVAFSDTISDTILQGVYSGVLWKNAIFQSKFRYKILQPTEIINNTIIAPKRVSLSAGPYLTYKMPAGTNIGVMATLQDKGGHLWTLGYGSDKTALIGLQWKIGKR